MSDDREGRVFRAALAQSEKITDLMESAGFAPSPETAVALLITAAEISAFNGAEPDAFASLASSVGKWAHTMQAVKRAARGNA